MKKKEYLYYWPDSWKKTQTHSYRTEYLYIKKGWRNKIRLFLTRLQLLFVNGSLNSKAQTNIALGLVVLLLILFSVISLLSQGTYGGADDLHHFRLSRYAFRYPGFFMDYWGKPLFTILSAPFAQLGYHGAKIYNVIAGILTAFFAFRLAQTRRQQNAILIIFFVLFAPVFMSLIPSAMTEITGSLCLVLAFYLYFKGNFSWAAFIISFIPLARTEGMLILPLFLIMLALRRQWKALLFLPAGLIIFSFAGWAHHHDLFWVFTKIPYGKFSAELYGSGSIFFYIENAGKIIGIPLALLFGAGVIVHILELIQTRFSLKSRNIDEFVLILLPVLLVLAFHSLAWYLGTGALALYRFMALIIPPAVYFSLKGYNRLEQLLSFKKTAIKIFLKVLVLALIIRTAFIIYEFPVPLDQSAKVIKEACRWIKTHVSDHGKVYYYDPNVFLFLEIDPHDYSRIQEKVPDRENPGMNVEQGGIVVWDAHFGPNEGGLPLQRLIESTDYTLLKKFEPLYPFKVLGDNDYMVYVFRKI